MNFTYSDINLQSNGASQIYNLKQSQSLQIYTRNLYDTDETTFEIKITAQNNNNSRIGLIASTASGLVVLIFVALALLVGFCILIFFIVLCVRYCCRKNRQVDPQVH